MPYLRCPSCGLITFSVAYWSSIEQCEGCGEPLPPKPRAYRPPGPPPRLLRQLKARPPGSPSRPPER
jgi:hypothetical protein